MNRNCSTCKANNLCVYEHKPTDCANMRKFKPHPDMVICVTCNNTGYKPYPMWCTSCNGTGAVIKLKEQQ